MAGDPQSLGRRIRRARERAHLSQAELAAAVGASKRAVGDWENNRTSPRNRLGALEEVLGERFDEEEPAPSIPPGILAVIKRNYPDPRQQALAIEAFEALGPPTGPSSTREEDESETRPGRAG
jgi:transcriptional regulator with XRE-family HTH domain